MQNKKTVKRILVGLITIFMLLPLIPAATLTASATLAYEEIFTVANATKNSIGMGRNEGGNAIGAPPAERNYVVWWNNGGSNQANGSSQYVEFTVLNVPSAGKYALDFYWYTRGDGPGSINTRKMAINATSDTDRQNNAILLSFNPTKSGVWEHFTYIATLREGSNTIRLWYDNTSPSNSWLILDHMRVRGPGELYNLTAKVDGKGGVADGSGSFMEGETVTASARPFNYYKFEGWYEDGLKIDGVGAEYTFTMAANRTIEAKFETDNDKVPNGFNLGDMSAAEEAMFDYLNVFLRDRGVSASAGQYASGSTNSFGTVHQYGIRAWSTMESLTVGTGDNGEQGFWHAANAYEALNTAYEMTDNEEQKALYKEIMDGYRVRMLSSGFSWPGNWRTNAFTDDLLWWANAFTRSYMLTKDIAFLDAGRMIYDRCWIRAWDNNPGSRWLTQTFPERETADGGTSMKLTSGGLTWNLNTTTTVNDTMNLTNVGNDAGNPTIPTAWGREKNNATNWNGALNAARLASIYAANPALEEEFLTYISQPENQTKYANDFHVTTKTAGNWLIIDKRTGEEFTSLSAMYAKQAQMIFDWSWENLVIDKTGQNAGKLTDNYLITNERRDWQFTYNYGLAGHAGIELWNLTGERKYLDKTKIILDHAWEKEFTRSDGLTMRDEDGMDGGDGAAFRLPLIRAMGRIINDDYLLEAYPQFNDYKKYMYANAHQAWNYRRDRDGLIGSDIIVKVGDSIKVHGCIAAFLPQILWYTGYDPKEDYSEYFDKDKLAWLPTWGEEYQGGNIYLAQAAKRNSINFGYISQPGSIGSHSVFWNDGGNNDNANGTSRFLEFEIYVAEAGIYQLDFRWFTRDNNLRSISINGGEAADLWFWSSTHPTNPIPEAEQRWEISSYYTDLVAGKNVIKIWVNLNDSRLFHDVPYTGNKPIEIWGMTPPLPNDSSMGWLLLDYMKVTKVSEYGTPTAVKTALVSAINTANLVLIGATDVAVSSDGTDIDGSRQWVSQANLDIFNGAIADAAAVNANADAPQEVVNPAVYALNQAIIAFNNAITFGTKPLPTTKTVLQNAIAAANAAKNGIEVSTAGTDIDGSKQWVGQSDLDTFDNAITSAALIFNNDAATQAEVDSAVTALQLAISAFNSAKQFGSLLLSDVDKTTLGNAIATANAAKADVVIDTAAGNVEIGILWVSQGDLDTFESAITSAGLVFNNVDATQTEINAAVTSLQSAISAFNIAKGMGTKSPVDKTILEAKIAAANAAKAGVVVDTSAENVEIGILWVSQSVMDTFDNAITSAGLVFNNVDATQTEINAAVTSLQSATITFNIAKGIGNVPVVKTALENAIAAANAAKNGIVVSTAAENVNVGMLWVSQSVMDTFVNAIADAVAVNADDDATQAAVDAAVTALQSSITAFNSAKNSGAKVTLYTVTVNNSYASTTGGGNYPASSTVTINAGSRSGYYFNGWTVNLGGVTLANASNEMTTFPMPAGNVTVTANWTAVGGGYVPSTPTPPSSSGDNNGNSDSGSGSSSGESGSGNDNNTGNTSSNILVDGKSVEAGTVEAKGDTTTVTVNQQALDKQLETVKDTVVVQVPSGNGTLTAKLLINDIEKMADKDIVLSVQGGKVTYSLPTNAIDTEAIIKGLGITDSTKAPVNITITTDVDAKTKNLVDNALKDNGELVIPPMSFTVTATYGGKTIEVTTFSAYVERTIEVTAEQAAKITTAVIVEADGTVRQVPTKVYKQGNKWYVSISSLTNSTYALINNEKKFTDIKGKWYEKSVTEMANRKIINGMTETTFAGNSNVTRAQFCAMVVRALGLPEKGNSSSFKDVSRSSWYYGAVSTAYKYDIVSGRSETAFDPESNITWQEAMVMVQRAAKIAGYKGYSIDISRYADSKQVSGWALDATKFVVGSGLLSSNNDGTSLTPLTAITRAETADMLLKLLRKAKLIDIR